MGRVALHNAALDGTADEVRGPLAPDADVLGDQWGNTPLWRAVFNANGDPLLVRLLVRAGADPDLENASSRTPRQLASTIANYDTSGYFEDV